MPLGRQITVCVKQAVKPEVLRNVDKSLHKEVRGHHLFLTDLSACGLVVFKGEKKI